MNEGLAKKHFLILLFLMKYTEIDYNKVAYLKADINYTDVFFDHGVNLKFPFTLKRFEEFLAKNENFIRIQRGVIINKKNIKWANEYEVFLNVGKIIPVSRRRKAVLFNVL